MTDDQRCPRCVMDRTDPDIVIGDASCSNCDRATDLLGFLPKSEAEEQERLAAVAEMVTKRRTSGVNYDCIVGASELRGV